MVLIFLAILNYLIDSYTIYAASVLAANSILRSLFGFAFPLFATTMYTNLGIHWASSVPAFLALACVPFPFLFYKYGAEIRKRCKYSKQAQEIMAELQGGTDGEKGKEEPKVGKVHSSESDLEAGVEKEGEGERTATASQDDEAEITQHEAVGRGVRPGREAVEKDVELGR